MHNGFITFENVITTEQRLVAALQSLKLTLRIADNNRWWIFYSTVIQCFRLGHVRVSSKTSEEEVGMGLECPCCCGYVYVEFKKKGTILEMEEARASLLPFISGCKLSDHDLDRLDVYKYYHANQPEFEPVD